MIEKSIKYIVIFIVFCVIFFSNQTALLVKTAHSESVNYYTLNPNTKNFVDRLSQTPNDFVFLKNLKRPSVIDPDVKYLKWILNSDSRTALSDDFNKSMSQLNNSFGPITQDAVKRFQTLYKDEILTPIGLSAPTGIVGDATRKKLNDLLNQSKNILLSKNNYNANSYANYTYNSSNNFVNFYPQTPQTNSFINTTTYNSYSSINTYTASTTNTYSISTSSTSASTSSYNTISNTGYNNQSIESNSNIYGTIAALAIGAGASALLNNSTQKATELAKNAVVSQIGGRVTFNMYCSCSANYLITVMDLSTKIPTSVIFQPGFSALKMNYMPTVGQSVLGGYIRTTTACFSGSSCTPIGTPIGIIDPTRGIGTTLIPISK